MTITGDNVYVVSLSYRGNLVVGTFMESFIVRFLVYN